MNVSYLYYAWLLGFVVLVALAIAFKDERRKAVISVLMVAATIFVGLNGYKSFQSRSNANLAYTQSDRAEILLKFTSGYVAIESYAASLPGSEDMSEQGKDKLYLEAGNLLDKAVDAAPKSSKLLLKKVVLLGEQGKNVRDQIKQLRAIKEEKADRLAGLLEALYVKRSVTKKDYPEFKKIVSADVPLGWYKEIVTLQLEKTAHHKKNFKELHQDFHEHYLWYMIRLFIFGCLAVLSFLVGLIVLVVQLFFLPRNPTSDTGKALIQGPPQWNWRVVFGVFIGWLATEFLIAPPIKHLAGHLANLASENGIVTVALLTAALYLFQNLPAIFLIWYLGIRPHKFPFFSTLKLKFKVEEENRGIFKLVTAGILTWYACIPVVAGAVYLSTKLGSQGSDNPIVAVVMAAAKEADLLGIVLFIVALGVLPALVEEILFRGFLYTALRRKLSIFPSLVISGFVFSAIHLDLGGFLQLFCLGFLFAFIMEKTRSLVPSMVAHCMWNSCTFIMALVAYS